MKITIEVDESRPLIQGELLRTEPPARVIRAAASLLNLVGPPINAGGLPLWNGTAEQVRIAAEELRAAIDEAV